MPKPAILISSCKRDADNGANLAVRETWGLDSPIPYFFVLGRGCVAKYANDLVLDVPDGWLDLPLKTKEGHRWALDMGFDFIFQCFVDTFIDTERLLASGFERNDYTGNKSEPYPGFTFAHGGPGYWTSRKAVKIVLDSPIDPAAFESDKYEDQWSGRRLGLAGIECFDDKRYSMGWSYNRDETAFCLEDNDTITVHLSSQTGLYEPEWMRQLYSKRYGTPFVATKPRAKGCSCKYCMARLAAALPR